MAGFSSALSATLPSTGLYGDAGAASLGLQEWLAGIVRDVPVTLVTGAMPAGSIGIAIRLVGIAPRVVQRDPARRSAALALDYLVTAETGDALVAHRAMSEIAFAVLGGSSYDLVADRSIAELCTAYGIVPSAGLVLRTELRRDAKVALAPLVREVPAPNLEPLIQARGRVVGPGNIPIPGALVTVAGSNRSCTTGPDGRFRFAIPAGQPATVTARARSREVSASLAPETETILTLQMEA